MFSLPHFVRRTPADSLRTYFAARLPDGFEVDWAGEPRDVQGSVQRLFQTLHQELRETIYADFEQVDQLCDEVGQRALRETVALADRETFDMLEGGEARGLNVLIADPAGFKRALSIAAAERLFHGQSWSRSYVSRPTPPCEEPDAIAEFAASLKDVFQDFDGSGRKIVVEHFLRTASAPTIMYMVFVEAPPQSFIEFDEVGPQRTTRRPVIEAVLCYDQIEGTLDIVAKGGRKTRDVIGVEFVRHILNSDAELLPIHQRSFDLDRLRRPIPFSTDPEDGIKTVRLTALRLRDLTSDAGRITIEPSDLESELHADAERWFGDANPLRLDTWRIEQARLQILFHPDKGGGRAKRITIELRAPNGSNLKEQIQRHDLISSKYLARWGLVRAG